MTANKLRQEIRPILLALFRNLFNAREGEERRACLMIADIFLIVSTLLIIKPVANAQFLSIFGAKQLPYVFLLVAIFAAAGSSFYSNLLKKHPLNRLIEITFDAVIVAFVLLWAFLYLGFFLGPVVYCFYIVVAIFAVVSTSQFWILANLVFNPREAKRLFGFLGAGAIGGGIFGGYLTNFLAPVIGSGNLLLFCVGMLSMCILLTRAVWKEVLRQRVNTSLRQKEQISQIAGSPLRTIINSRHLTLIACIVGVSVLVAKLVEFQFSAIASSRILDEDELTAFFGFWLSNINMASLMIQLFLTRRVVGMFGVGLSLFVLPLAIAFGALAVLLLPALWSAILLKMSDGSLKQSINKAGTELLSLPIPAEVKNQAKTFIDVFVDSFATGMSGILLIVLTFGLGFSVRMISIVNLACIAGWVYLVSQVRWEYIRSFRLQIQSKTNDILRPSLNLKSESVMSSLVKILESDNEKNILQAIRMAKQVKHKRLVPCFEKLLNHPNKNIRLEVLRNIYVYRSSNFTPQVEKLIYDPDPAVKAEAFHYLFRRYENHVQMLKNYLSHKDPAIRDAALLCVARESRSNVELKEAFKLQETVTTILKRTQHAEDDQREAKILCAKIIGLANLTELYPYLHILLTDPDPEVQKAAIYGAGHSRNGQFLPILLRCINQKEFREAARSALQHFGPEALEKLDIILLDPNQDLALRSYVPSIVASIGVQKSVDILMQLLEKKDLVFRYDVIRALNRLRIRFPNLNFNDNVVEQHILNEARIYAQTLAALETQAGLQSSEAGDAISPENSTQVKEARGKLKTLLEKKLDENLERIFRLLGLKYPPDDIYQTYIGLTATESDVRLHAVEFLDNLLLDVSLKRLLIPIVETAAGDAMAETALKQLGVKELSEFEGLSMILTGDDDTLICQTIYLIAYLQDDMYVPQIGRFVSHPDAAVRKAAHFALRRLGFLKG